LAACRHAESDLHAQLGEHLTQVASAQAQAAAHWDALIIGNGADCQDGLVVPPYFNLTQAQADAYPAALLLRDYLYVAVTHLQESSQVWDTLCADPAPLAAPETVDRGYKAAQNARSSLDQAQATYATWNP